MEYFWTNTIWYILLGLSAILELILFLKKAERRAFTLAYYFTVSGITLTVEVLLFILLGAYHYYPKILLTSPYDDELMGNLFSQFSVAATGLFIAVYRLKFRWIPVFAIAYGIVEEGFLALGIYKQEWYRTWYTVLGLIVFFTVIKSMYRFSLRGGHALLHYINILFSLMALDVVTVIWAFMMSGVPYYSRSFGYDPVASPYLVAYMYSCGISIIFIITHFLRLKARYKGIVIVSMVLLNYLLWEIRVLYFNSFWWYLVFSVVYFFSDYFSIVLMDKLLKLKPRRLKWR